MPPLHSARCPVARQKLSQVFCISMATVTGPTPPGTGVSHEATSATERASTSPTIVIRLGRLDVGSRLDGSRAEAAGDGREGVPEEEGEEGGAESCRVEAGAVAGGWRSSWAWEAASGESTKLIPTSMTTHPGLSHSARKKNDL